jgi:hypothetical protein
MYGQLTPVAAQIIEGVGTGMRCFFIKAAFAATCLFCNVNEAWHRA